MKRLAAILALCVLPVFCSPASAAELDEEVMRDEAFRAAQWMLASEAGQAMTQLGLRLAAGDGELAEAIRAQQDMTRQWQEAGSRLSALPENAPAEQRRAIEAEQRSFQQQAEQMDATLRQDFPRYAELTRPEAVSITDAQALLREDEALLLFLAGPRQTYVFVVTRERADWQRADLGAEELERDVRNLRAALDPTSPARGAAPLNAGVAAAGRGFDFATAHDLYNRLLKPLEPVFAGKQNILVVPDGALSSLPLSVLLTDAPPEAGPDAFRRASWLIRDHAVTVLPNISGLAALRREAVPSRAQLAFLGFGAPSLTGGGGAVRGVSDMFKGATADVEAVRSLPPLPGTERELRALAEVLGQAGSLLFIGDGATESAVKHTDLSAARVLAFATHGLVAGELGGLAEPALVLTPPETAGPEDDGLLTASEAAALRLDADWVVLSACNTAAPDGTPGAEGLSGLARAFLFAGTRAILVSHWPVRDDAAGLLTEGIFTRLAADPEMGRAEALRQSMLALIDGAEDPGLADPSAWAPFVIVGEGAR
jgi:CHAT domain-containing protein